MFLCLTSHRLIKYTMLQHNNYSYDVFMEEAYLSTWKVGKTIINHCGGLLKLMSVSLFTMKVSKSILNHCGGLGKETEV